jgi:hypothetical protein
LTNDEGQGRLNIDRIRQEIRWEPWKAFAAMIGVAAGMRATAVAAWLSQHWH